MHGTVRQTSSTRVYPVLYNTVQVMYMYTASKCLMTRNMSHDSFEFICALTVHHISSCLTRAGSEYKLQLCYAATICTNSWSAAKHLHNAHKSIPYYSAICLQICRHRLNQQGMTNTLGLSPTWCIMHFGILDNDSLCRTEWKQGNR